MAKREVLSLIRKLPYRKDIKDSFRTEVDAHLYTSHKTFLSNPLLISIMLLTYGEFGIPSKMHLFYEQAFEALFLRHDASKEGGFQRVRHCYLTIDQFRDCLSSFAIASYRKLQYEFTMLSVIDLIKKAAKFEKLQIDPEALLRDFVESVCVLQVEGVLYKFVHRSFQEYFAALFITRAPPVPLANLLDNLARRRGDTVIPMAVEINRSLIEREWLLRRVRELDLRSSECEDNYRFAKYLFGDLVCEATILGPQRIRARDGALKPALNLVYTLRSLYPQHVQGAGDILQLSDEDLGRIRPHWEQSRARLRLLDPLAEQRRMPSRDNRNDSWTMDDDDATWFCVTTVADRLQKLREQIRLLREHVDESVSMARVIGEELFD